MEETDLNLQIIEKVKEFPDLYQGLASLDRRKIIWQNIADSLQVGAPFVLSRWHCLLEQYMRLVNEKGLKDLQKFKYRKDMEFFLPFIKFPNSKDSCAVAKNNNEKESSVETEYEYIISEADLEDMSSDQSDYNFLEVNDVDEVILPKAKKIKTNIEEDSLDEIRKENESKEILVSTREPYLIDEDFIQVDDDDENEFLVQQSVNKIIVKVEDTSEKDEQSQESKQKNRTLQVASEVPSPTHQHISNSNENSQSSCNSNSNSNASSDPSPTSCETEKSSGNELSANESEKERKYSKPSRCEDEIFGELVTAMLKKMSPDKKRSVKKEIMNILL